VTAFTTAVIVVLASTSVLLLAFGMNLLFLTWRAMRLHPARHDPAPRGVEPLVCVQIPVYNERYVAERVIDAVCEIEWPPSRLEVQVLDDSDDDTVAIVEERLARWRRRGLNVTHVRRKKRIGFKAGALAHGMTLTSAPFIAIFDADFVPPADFLRRTIGVFADESIGFVQARWGHLDEGYSWFTRLQALAIDFHFLVEQAVRSARGYFTNFTGTAGVWRRSAIADSGGWSAATLTEDLDLSYRAQLRGWKAAYLEDLVVPEELPVSIDAYRRQQSRWATGSFQGAFRLLLPVMRSRNRPAVKLAAAVGLPVVGTSDCHLDEQFGTTFSLIDAEPSVESVLSAIKKGRVSVVSRPLTLARCASIAIRLALATGKEHTRTRLRPSPPPQEAPASQASASARP